jgi:cation:H+ antiporter
LQGLEALAVSWGISSFVFIQWCAPFVSEFPEKITAFNWARQTRKAPLALLNMVSSNVVQWTMMAGMLPLIYNVSLGHYQPIYFDEHQEAEILLTIIQSYLSIVFLMDLDLNFFDAFGLLALWLMQFIVPQIRHEIIYVYLLWILIELISLIRKKKLVYAMKEFWRVRRVV